MPAVVVKLLPLRELLSVLEKTPWAGKHRETQGYPLKSSTVLVQSTHRKQLQQSLRLRCPRSVLLLVFKVWCRWAGTGWFLQKFLWSGMCQMPGYR